jgi:hypothetical protein
MAELTRMNEEINEEAEALRLKAIRKKESAL